MLLKKCFLIKLLAVMAVSAVGVGAAGGPIDVILTGNCNPPSSVYFMNQIVGANDVIRNVSIDSFLPCSKTAITEISFHSSSIYSFPAIVFTTFPNLQLLFMLNSNLQEIKPNTFQNAKKLTNLTMFDCMFTSLNASTFAGATSLQELQIVGNMMGIPGISGPIMTVNVNAFRGLPALTMLSLMGANLTSIDKAFFIDNTKLKALILAYNLLKSINPNTVSSLVNLEGLSIAGNQLTSLDKNLLQYTTKLKQIYLASNQLSALDDGFFKYTPNLTYMGLAGNRFEIITDALFANTRLLFDLDLSCNRIKSLSSSVFQNLPNLKSLKLSGNCLTSLPKDMFSNNPQLNIVELQDNLLNAIYKTTFSNLKNLNILSLKNNTCVDAEFEAPRNETINATTVMNALAKCDPTPAPTTTPKPTTPNYNCPDPIKEQLDTIANVLANVSSILNIIASKL
jgi:Leucine-rich repeat (LRR) protein